MVEGSGSDRRKELDKDISSYISILRKREKRFLADFLKKFKRKKKKPKAELHPEVNVYGKDKENEKKKKSKEDAEKEEEEMEQHFEEGTSRKSFWGWLKGMLFSAAEAPEDFEVSEKEAEKEEIREKETEERSELEEEYTEEVQNPGWISRLLGRIFVKSREEEELEDAADEIAEDVNDMKIIAEIATKVMKMLPPEKMKEFKQSEEFHKFKEILKKRELIK